MGVIKKFLDLAGLGKYDTSIKEYINDKIPANAEEIDYDNTDSGLTADNVQKAVDEIADASNLAIDVSQELLVFSFKKISDS